MSAPRKKLTRWQLFTLGLATIGGAKANNRVVPYNAHGNRKSTGLATNSNRRNWIRFVNIPSHIPTSIKLAKRVAYNQVANNPHTRRQMEYTGTNAIYPNNNKKSNNKTKLTLQNTRANLKHRLGVAITNPGTAASILRRYKAIKNENVTQLSKLTNNQMKLSNENKKLEKSHTNALAYVNEQYEKHVVKNLSRLTSKNKIIQNSINKVVMKTNANKQMQIISTIYKISPEIKNVSKLLTILNADGIELSRDANKALGGIEKAMGMLQDVYDNEVKHFKEKVNITVLKTLENVVQQQITSEDLLLTPNDIIILQHIINGTKTNKIIWNYLRPGAITPDKLGNSLALSIIYSYLAKLSPIALAKKLNLRAWINLENAHKHKDFIKYVVLILSIKAIPNNIPFVSKIKKINYILTIPFKIPYGILKFLIKNIKRATVVSMIIACFCIYYGAVPGPEAIVTQIVSMTELLQ